MNGWMVLSMGLGVLLVPALLSLRTASRDHTMVDAALLRTLNDLYAARDVHARECALQDSVIRALIDTCDQLQQDLFAQGEHLRQELADRNRELRIVSASRDQVMAALKAIQDRLIEMRHEVRGQVADAPDVEELGPH